jgi:hypothetical protein
MRDFAAVGMLGLQLPATIPQKKKGSTSRQPGAQKFGVQIRFRKLCKAEIRNMVLEQLL